MHLRTEDNMSFHFVGFNLELRLFCEDAIVGLRRGMDAMGRGNAEVRYSIILQIAFL